MKFNTKYRLCLYKGYFDKGIGLTSYTKYLIAFFGLASRDVKTTLIIAAAYFIFCVVLGWWWYKSDFIRAEHEVGNKFNLFQQEIRAKFK